MNLPTEPRHPRVPYLGMSAMTDDRDAYEIPVLRPMLPPAAPLLPYLSRIDASRCYTNWARSRPNSSNASPMASG